jgi:hypothetical protein
MSLRYGFYQRVYKTLVASGKSEHKFKFLGLTTGRAIHKSSRNKSWTNDVPKIWNEEERENNAQESMQFISRTPHSTLLSTFPRTFEGKEGDYRV